MRPVCWKWLSALLGSYQLARQFRQYESTSHPSRASVVSLFVGRAQLPMYKSSTIRPIAAKMCIRDSFNGSLNAYLEQVEQWEAALSPFPSQ